MIGQQFGNMKEEEKGKENGYDRRKHLKLPDSWFTGNPVRKLTFVYLQGVI